MVRAESEAALAIRHAWTVRGWRASREVRETVIQAIRLGADPVAAVGDVGSLLFD
ncbi:MAG: hypothetical protein ACRDWA_00400 [Acidimicrobiia bacterium]